MSKKYGGGAAKEAEAPEMQETSMGPIPVGYPLGGPVPTNLAKLQAEEKARQEAAENPPAEGESESSRSPLT